MASDNSQSRKWQLTINNPVEHNITDDIIKETIIKFAPDYWCMCKEIGNNTKTYHIHIFIYSTSPIRFTTLKNRFPTAHIEKSFGSVQQNVDYIKKEGKWQDTDKTETIVKDSFYEQGIMPTEKQEDDPLMTQLLEDIKDNKSIVDIIEATPKLAFKIKDIDTIRQTYLADKYMSENRNIVCTYIYGKTGVGKTRNIFKEHGAENICRITNYKSIRGVLFDNYNNAQSILVFEEFNSQIPIEDMLNYLDIYPVMLPARYNDKVACYEKIFITSNLPFEEQYKDYSCNRFGNTWNIYDAWVRRIHNIIEYKADGSLIYHKQSEKKELEELS